MDNFTPTEQQLLEIIQTDFPLTVRPYQTIGQRLEKTETEVIEMLHALKARNIIRQISAIFNGRFLGFEMALVCFQVEEENLEEAAQIVNAHPGVSHNYQREHRFNLWFTLSVPHDLKIERHVQTLARLTVCPHFLYLPGVKTFKRRVQFTWNISQNMSPIIIQPSDELPKLSRKIILPEEIQCGIMNELQHDLPLSPTPFTKIARRFDIDPDTLFQFLADLQAVKKMARFAGIVRHRQLGFTANAMVVWDVPAEMVDTFGQYASAKGEISHCYERVTYPEWPYNLYTMIHGQSREETHKLIDELATKFSLNDYQILYSGKEFKKQRVNYFDKSIYEWHQKWIGEEGR